MGLIVEHDSKARVCTHTVMGITDECRVPDTAATLVCRFCESPSLCAPVGEVLEMPEN
jgi:hypothetical protein